MASSQPELPVKEKVTCVSCGKDFVILLSHLKRTKNRKNPCKDSYDMQFLEAEADRLHREQMATRNRERYHNDLDEPPKKRAASKKLYDKDPERKKETMAKYYQEHKEDLSRDKS